jgi:hypothetical protein
MVMRQTMWAALAVAACLLAAPLAGASNNSAFADGAGDAPASAPDVTSVQVSNDNAGSVSFRISIPNRAELEDPDFIALLLDTDGNARTGCARGTFGAEYALDVLSRKFVFGRCARGQWSFAKNPASFSGSFAESTLTLRANRRDLGGARGFTFRIGAAAAGEHDATYDFAPNIGTSAWTYKVVAPPPAVKKPPKRKRPRRAPVRLRH